jgi:hypothetical protein
MFETIEPDQSVFGNEAFVMMDSDSSGGGVEALRNLTDPVDDGADKIIQFVDNVTSLPQRLENTGRALNDYLIDVGQRIGKESEEKARENLGGFKISDTIQTTAESAGAWIQNNWLIVIGVLIAIYFFRK